MAPAFTLLSLAAFWAAGLYHGLWRYAGTATVFQIVRGVSLSALAWAVVAMVSLREPFPRGIAILIWLWELALMGGVRLAWRLWRERVLGGSGARLVPTLVIGADHAGVSLVQEMRRRHSGEESLQPLGFVDADPRLTGHLVEGLKVFGTLGDVARVLEQQRPEVAVVANPELPARVVRDLAAACAAAFLSLAVFPCFAQGTAAPREAALPVTKVVLFSSGVGYFEHRGSVTGDSVVPLPFARDDSPRPSDENISS